MSYSIQSHKINEFLEMIGSGDVQLAEFQRKWVWDDKKVTKLLTSVLKGYPIGTLMLLQIGSKRFKARPLHGTSVVNEPQFLIIDGQQRATTLYQNCISSDPILVNKKNKVEYRKYFIDVSKLGIGSLDEAICSIQFTESGDPIDCDFNPSDLEDLTKKLWLPVCQVLNPRKWLDKAETIHVDHPGIFLLEKTYLSRFTRDLHAYHIDGRTDLERVSEIYQSLNTSGEPLATFDLLIAKHAVDDLNLYELWFGPDAQPESGVKARILRHSKDLKHIADPKYFSLGIHKLSKFLSNDTAPWKEIDVSANQYREYSELLVEGYQGAFQFLRNQGFTNEAVSPQAALIHQLAVIYSVMKHRNWLPEETGQYEKLTKWFWRIFLSESYDKHVESRVVSETDELHNYLFNGGDLPSLSRVASVSIDDVIQANKNNMAITRGVCALIAKAGAMDFGGMTPIKDLPKIEIHHVFPKKWCQDNGFKSQMYDSIVNKTPIAPRPNKRIGYKSPHDYFKYLDKQCSEASPLEDSLKLHGIPVSEGTDNNFSGFFLKRLPTVLALISAETDFVFDVSNLGWSDIESRYA